MSTANDNPDPSSADGPSQDPAGEKGDESQRWSQLTATASRVVGQAASVLEEELAVGISAAEQAEHKFIDVDRIRSEESSVVLQRLRKDAHDVVDILIDLVNVAVNSAEGLANQAVRLRAAGQDGQATSRTTPGIPTLVLPGTVVPGNGASTAMSIDNEANEPLQAFRFTATDLISTSGERIPASSLRLDPPSVTVEPQASERIAVNVDVPEDAAQGTYSGLLQASQLSSVRAVVIVTVGSPAAT